MSENISVSNQHYSTVNGLTSNSIKSLFVAEGERLLGAAQKCEELWDEMRRADFRKENILNEANIQLIFLNKKKILNTLLRIETVSDFMSVFDDDLDGFLNEDEQILVFTIICHRIQVIADELCSLKKYELYKDLMKEIRSIEQQINKYQNELRQNVHKKQLDNYINIGKEMQSEFDNKWLTQFDSFRTRENREKQLHEEQLKKEIDMYYQIEASKINGVKVKRNHNLRLLANQEKLVAINERVEEAVNFRNELIKLEKKDQERLDKLKCEMLTNLNNKININEQKEKAKIADRFRKEHDKLIISKNKETDILNKQINLHISDIVRMQNSLSNMYLDIGSKEDEINRLKQRQRKTNETIAQFKSIKSKVRNPYGSGISQRDIALGLIDLAGKTLNLNSSTESGCGSKFGNEKHSIQALKYMIKTRKMLRFDINSDFNARKFCNVNEDEGKGRREGGNGIKRKIKSLIEQRQHKDEIMIPPSYYYDEYLSTEINAKNYRDILPRINTNNL